MEAKRGKFGDAGSFAGRGGQNGGVAWWDELTSLMRSMMAGGGWSAVSGVCAGRIEVGSSRIVDGDGDVVTGAGVVAVS